MELSKEDAEKFKKGARAFVSWIKGHSFDEWTVQVGEVPEKIFSFTHVEAKFRHPALGFSCEWSITFAQSYESGFFLFLNIPSVQKDPGRAARLTEAIFRVSKMAQVFESSLKARKSHG